MEGKQIDAKKNFFQEYWLLLLVLIYLILPIDLIPDSIPFVGTLDDAGLLLVYLLEAYSKWKRNSGEKDIPSSDVKEGEIVK